MGQILPISEVRGPCAFDILFTKNMPHIMEAIFLSLDYETFQISIVVNMAWNKELTVVG